MGTTASQIGKDRLAEYQELTFLTKQEILLAHKKFSELLTKDERDLQNIRVPMETDPCFARTQVQPFQEQNLPCVFNIKSHYAFRIFDFDDDGTLDCGDLEKLVNCLTGETDDTRLTSEEMRQLISNILEESDIDKDWNCEPLRVSACDFKITRLCQFFQDCPVKTSRGLRRCISPFLHITTI
ncbi:unnamed protein product [Pleuronectes platessa]|uniref:EF-hand domain-containing protein n=1 Tax=Pleuronectes platessa TaxID=8262 RepID=A0A9N7YX08_PLEPL|nr:unnamed protein product [Pleuronectes platessa]